MKHFYFFIMLLLIVFLSCTKQDNGYRAAGAETVVIKGYEYRNEIGQTLARIGNPDIKIYVLTDISPEINKFALLSFPNPSTDEVTVIIEDFNFLGKARVWIVPASFSYEDPDGNINLGMTVVPQGMRPLLDTTFTFTNRLTEIRLHGLSYGYYRIYMKADEDLLWDNLVVSNTVPIDH